MDTSVSIASPYPAPWIFLTKLLGDFLSILSEIERNYLWVVSITFARFLSHVMFLSTTRLDDDRDVASNGDGNTNPVLMTG